MNDRQQRSTNKRSYTGVGSPLGFPNLFLRLQFVVAQRPLLGSANLKRSSFTINMGLNLNDTES